MIARTSTLGVLALGVLALSTPARPAAALTFDFTTIAGDTLTADEAAAFTTAANAWSAAVTDPFTVTLQIGFRSLGASTLGASSPSLVSFNANVVKAALAADETSSRDAAAVASLPAYGASASLLLTTAEARALGFRTTGSDGSIEFSSDFPFSTARSAQGTVAAGTYDLVGIAEHEIGHMLGFVSGLTIGPGYSTLLDQFRFLSPGVRNTATVAGAYFSLDGGATSLAQFSPGPNDSYQASHWLEGTGGLMDPALPAGTVQNITPLDLTAFDVIGYDLATAVDEPAGGAVLAAGLLGLAVLRRRRTG